jgi:glycosyltransferase involved in cell wall biosynthesis
LRIKVLFIGTFLSKKRGTKGIAESLSERLKEEGVSTRLSSCYENKVIRMFDILLSIFFFRGRIVHIDVFSGSAFNIADLASSLAKFRKKKILMTLHGGRLPEFSGSNMPRIKRIFERTDKILTPSMFIQEHFRKLGFKVEYLPNSIDLSNFRFDRTTMKPNSLLWVRAFTSIYNPEVPIKLLASLKEKYPDCTLTMIGPDRGLMEKCKELADSLGVSKDISFLGSVPNNELYAYYQTHAVYLNTTSYESFGVAVVEAASCGIPIVSNNVGEIPYLWNHKENIMLVENNSFSMYCDCINELFDSSDLSSKLSINARKKSERFNWPEIKNEWLNILT